jgi:hypothetical protein
MKLLADQDVYAATIRFLNGFGHDVVPVDQLRLATATALGQYDRDYRQT